MIVHPVLVMPLLHEQLVTALPAEQVIESVTVEPLATAADAVLGDWLMLQFEGAVGPVCPPPPLFGAPIWTVVENVAPGPAELVGVTVNCVVLVGATVSDAPMTPMFHA